MFSSIALKELIARKMNSAFAKHAKAKCNKDVIFIFCPSNSFFLHVQRFYPSRGVMWLCLRGDCIACSPFTKRLNLRLVLIQSIGGRQNKCDWKNEILFLKGYIILLEIRILSFYRNVSRGFLYRALKSRDCVIERKPIPTQRHLLTGLGK